MSAFWGGFWYGVLACIVVSLFVWTQTSIWRATR